MKITQLQGTAHSERALALVVLIATATFILLPVFLQSTFISGDDELFHIYNTQRYADELRDGVAYPRWFGDWFFGYGAPLGIIYPPLPYYAAGFLTDLGMSAFTALKIVAWVSLVVSGWAMYQLVVEFLPTSAALGASVFYQAAPYHTIDLYTRGALPEYVAFVWPPLIVLYAYRVLRTPALFDYIALALAVAGIVLTHTFSAYMVVVMMMIYVFVLLRRLRIRLQRILPRLAFSTVLAVALAGIFLLPVLFEMKYTYSAWYSEAVPWGGYADNFLFNVFTGTTLRPAWFVNIATGIGAVLSIGLVGAVMILNRRDSAQRHEYAQAVSSSMAVVFAISTALAFVISNPLWMLLPGIKNLQFPWRWQAISTLAVAYLAGDAFNYLARIQIPKIEIKHLLRVSLTKVLAGLLVLHVLWSAAIVANRVLRHEPIPPSATLSAIERPADVNEIDFWIYSISLGMLPVWAKGFDYYDQPVHADNRVVGGDSVQIEISEWHSSRRSFHISSASETILNVRSFWFPGWNAEVNGRPVPLSIKPEDGTILIMVPAGDSEVEMWFGDTPIRTIGILLSSAGVVVIVACLIWMIRSRRRIAT